MGSGCAVSFDILWTGKHKKTKLNSTDAKTVAI